MSRFKKGSPKGTVRDIDQGLGDLFGALTDAIGEMVTRIEAGDSGKVTRHEVFDTGRGPIRAQAGVTLRMGGVAGTEEADTYKPVKRTNPSRQSQHRSVPYEVIEEKKYWVLTAEVPGITENDLDLSQKGTTLLLRTTGTRQYAVDVDLENEFNMNDVAHDLRNGILTVQIRRSP